MFSKDSVVGVVSSFRLYFFFCSSFLLTIAKLLDCSLFWVVIMCKILLCHSDLKSIPLVQVRLIIQGLWNLYIIVSYHGLIRSTMKLNVSVEKQKYFQNVGGIVEFCSFPAWLYGHSYLHMTLWLVRILWVFFLIWEHINSSATKLSNNLVSKARIYFLVV